MYVYSNNGLSFHMVAQDYQPVDGEVTFEDVATEDQLALSFPRYVAITKAQKAVTDGNNGYDAAVAAGCQIVSTSTPSLNATYGLDRDSIDNIVAVGTSIANGLGFPNGQTTFGWPDINYVPHDMTEDQFKHFGAGIQGFVQQLKQWRLTTSTGGTAQLPSQPVTIA